MALRSRYIDKRVLLIALTFLNHPPRKWHRENILFIHTDASIKRSCFELIKALMTKSSSSSSPSSSFSQTLHQGMTASEVLERAEKIVLKFGSSLVCRPDGDVRKAQLLAFAQDIADLRAQGKQVIIVTSGAVALGRGQLDLDATNSSLRLDEKQAAAAAGQIPLVQAWQSALAPHDHSVAQILLTMEDTENRKRYLNARTTLETLLGFGIIPLVNENDTMATEEIRYGDNDRLAAHTAQMIGADLLVLLSDIDGLYNGNPTANPNAKHIPLVPQINEEISTYAQGRNEETGMGSGGMITKISAAQIATNAGASVIVADGQADNPDTNSHNPPLKAIRKGVSKSTLFLPVVKALTARQQWISGRQKPTGKVIIDNGAARALADGASLLPAGIKELSGSFQLGDLISVESQQGQIIGLGLASYNSEEIEAIKGLHSEETEAVLGYRRRPAFIHRDDLVLKNFSG